jgi:predicted esterase
MRKTHQGIGLGLVIIVGLCSGCPQYADPRVPEPIQPVVEPVTGAEYLQYTPSRYDPARPTPLVIVCHGTRPWDSPIREIRDWVKLAEEKNFIVAAPPLKGTRGDFPPPAAKQIERQRDDEETILAAVRHIEGGKNIDRSRVFLVGWSAGNYAVMYTGLRHPEIFRALAGIQGNFDSAFVTDLVGHIDPYQPVLVLYGSADLLINKQVRECAEWLYDQNAYVVDNELPGPHRSHPQTAYEFFERVVRQVPWLRLRAFAPNASDPYTVQFKTQTSFEPVSYDWSFGDGETSPVARPVHTYRQAGSYKVTLTVTTQTNKEVVRAATVTVPQGRIQTDL